MTTSKDVARLAHVSQATVSRVLAGSSAVTAQTRARVQAAVGQLSYHPNLVARNLVRGGSRTVAVGGLGQDGASLPMSTLKRTSYYYLDVLASVEQEAARQGYDVVFVSRQLESARDFVQELVTRQVAGAIVIPIGGDEQVLALQAAGIPTVAIDARLSGPRAASIYFDSYLGMRQATNYLLHLGHRRMAFFKFRQQTLAGVERYRGWHDAVTDAGVSMEDQVVREAEYTMQGGYEAALNLLGERRDYTAISASCDVMAYGILRALAEYRLRVPDDMSVMGFDDIDFSAFATPPLTTVRQDGALLGKEAVRLLLGLMDGTLAGAASVLPPQLLIRTSTSPPRGSTAGSSD